MRDEELAVAISRVRDEVSGYLRRARDVRAAAGARSYDSIKLLVKTIYATSFGNSGLSGSLMFNSCNRLMDVTDGFVPSTASGASVCRLGPDRPEQRPAHVVLGVLLR